MKNYPSLNVDKTKSMLMPGNDFRCRKINSILVSVCGTEADGVEGFKYLYCPPVLRGLNMLNM